jgi:hypothetical protein
VSDETFRMHLGRIACGYDGGQIVEEAAPTSAQDAT